MLEDSRLKPMNHSSVIQSISRYVCQAIFSIYLSHPEWLNEKFKNQPWESQKFQDKFFVKVVEEFSKTEDKNELIVKTIKVFDNFLLPSFFVSSTFSEVMENLRQITQTETVISSNQVEESKPADNFARVRAESTDSATAVLLLDAENLPLNVETENFLAGCCTYPIRIKIAFANWRSMGKQDIEYHGRSYELIHVPASKDSADIKMATVGASIFLHYPTAKEVLICSSDKALLHLRNTLQAQGLTVYLVRKQGETIIVVNSITGNTQTYAIKPIPTIDQFIHQVKNLILEEQKNTSNQWVKLSRISQLYQVKYKTQINQVVTGHLPGKKAQDIFVNYPADFVVHQPAEKSEFYVTLFQPARSSAALETQTPDQITTAKVLSQTPLNITSKDEMEQALVKIVMALTANSPESFVSLSNVGAEFYKHYGQPITKVMTALKLGSKLSKFLLSCSGFKVKNIENQYLVSLSQV
ncbi:NYN domain-containing protein [Microcoleus sp. FACHB-68]|nr:NYN domain-containing protein [Microcoleus sp. FACHB-68]